MGIYTLADIETIIADNPNKDLVSKARSVSAKLVMHLYGKELSSHLHRDANFESEEIFKSRTERPVSNKDMFQRLLQQEDMVFTARGGASNFGLDEQQEQMLSGVLANIRHDLSLRNWIRNFALPAYRSDPMGVVFMEVEQVASNTSSKTPKCYPTYKSSESIYDYLPNGRDLEYICFTLSAKELKAYGVSDLQATQPGVSSESKPRYFRFVDDSQDVIVKYTDNKAALPESTQQKNPIPNQWRKTPAIIVSDLIQFDDPQCFASPVGFVIELADCFLRDRSIRDLQKKYHGFAKAVEPLMQCSTCEGAGIVKGSACVDCTPVGASKGTGYKLKTKVSDVAKFPLDIIKESGFDFRKVFGYVAPDITTWNKQDTSLEDQERTIYRTYWGTDMAARTSGARMDSSGGGGNLQETATKTIDNLQPKYARLNATADWAEKLENTIATFVGKHLIPDAFKQAQITYGRNWILETPAELLAQYYESRKNGVPDFLLDEMLEKYIRVLYQNNPTQLAKYLKLLAIEPFPHIDTKNCLPPGSQPSSGAVVIPSHDDYLAKIYFCEWFSTLSEVKLISTKTEKLRADLKTYCEKKELADEPDTADTAAKKGTKAPGKAENPTE
jgi:hypothetical protein